MKIRFWITGVIVLFLSTNLSLFASQSDKSAGDLSDIKTIMIKRGLAEAGKNCIDCHKDKSPGIVNDWKNSRHSHVSVSCIDCHEVSKGAPNATQHENLAEFGVYISALV